MGLFGDIIKRTSEIIKSEVNYRERRAVQNATNDIANNIV